MSAPTTAQCMKSASPRATTYGTPMFGKSGPESTTMTPPARRTRLNVDSKRLTSVAGAATPLAREGGLHRMREIGVVPMERLTVAHRRREREVRDDARRVRRGAQAPRPLDRAVLVRAREVGRRRTPQTLLHLGVHRARI